MKQFVKNIVVTLLTWEAQLALRRYKPKVVGVTGSVGKTSTKDAVYTVMRTRARVRKSEKSFNSELGVPLTVLGLPNAWNSLVGWLDNVVSGLLNIMLKQTYPEWLVLEIGADRPGDITSLGEWIKPDIVVLTRFPEVPVHIEYFGSREAVIEEKRALRRALKEDGTLIVNADDELVRDEPIREGQHRYAYGTAEGADVRAVETSIEYHKDGTPRGMKARVRYQDRQGTLHLTGALGTHHLYPLLAAAAVGVSEGMTLKDACDALKEHTAPPGRMRILEGKRDTTLIDDTYNSSPVALHAALDSLKELTVKGRKLVVLGDMMELGTFSVEEHEAVGAHVADAADVFIAVGIRMKSAAQAAQKHGMKKDAVHTCESAKEATTLVEQFLEEGDTVLLKGSQSMRIERVTKALLADSVHPADVLVRQDSEWDKR